MLTIELTDKQAAALRDLLESEMEMLEENLYDKSTDRYSAESMQNKQDLFLYRGVLQTMETARGGANAND